MILLLARYILKAAIRDKLPLIFLVSVAISLSLSAFLGSSSITEQDQFVVVFAASALRLLSIAFIVLYISFYFNRAFESREIETMLTRPFTRLQFLLGHYLSFQILVLIFSVLSFLVFLLFKAVLADQYMVWFIGLFIELSLMASVTIFFAMLCSNNVAAIILSFGFYILGRLSGSLLSIIDINASQNILIKIGEIVMQLISVVVPRFDLMAQTSWLLYDLSITSQTVIIIMLQFIVFSGLVLTATFYDLLRKQF